MIVNTAIFTCSICGEVSTNICAYCTKDACSNHRCARCKRCSDCCECEVPLSVEEPMVREAPAQEEPLAVEPLEVESVVRESAVAATGFAGSDVLLTPEEASVFAPEAPAGPNAIEVAEIESPDDRKEASE
jgi:hypothetical protein